MIHGRWRQQTSGKLMKVTVLNNDDDVNFYSHYLTSVD